MEARQQGWPDRRQFKAYDYQAEFMGALVSGAYLHLILVINRRAGKDKGMLNATVEKMQQRVGNYVHVFPTLAQGRQNLWENIDGEGMRTIDHFPKDMIEGQRDDIMRVKFKNGSTWRVGGANNPDTWRGGNPVGIVWSEYPMMKPSVRLIADPILRQNGGWEAYIYTPKGSNHGKSLYDTNLRNPEWYVQLLTNDDTLTVTAEQLDEMRRSGYPEEWIQQEWYCSFSSPMVGSYYAQQIEALERAGMVGHYPWVPEQPVEVSWDLGIGADDAMSLWFIQALAGGFRIIDCYETNTEGLPDVVRMLREKPYVYGTAYFPHDIRKRELSLEQGRGAGTRLDTILRLMPEWKRNHRVIPQMSPADRIAATRTILPRCQFNAHGLTGVDAQRPGCDDGIEALKSYQREIDETKSKDQNVPFFKNHPLHNWACHYADSFGHFAVGTPHVARAKPRPQPGDEDALQGIFPRGRGGRGGRGGWMG